MRKSIWISGKIYLGLGCLLVAPHEIQVEVPDESLVTDADEVLDEVELEGMMRI